MGSSGPRVVNGTVLAACLTHISQNVCHLRSAFGLRQAICSEASLLNVASASRSGEARPGDAAWAGPPVIRVLLGFHVPTS